MAEQAERGLFIRSVAPVAEWLRWDGRGGNWGGWRWGSPQRDRATRRANEGYAHRTVPAGWCRHASSMAQIAPLVAGRNDAKEEAAAPAARSGGGDGVRPGRTFLGQVSLHLDEVRGEPEGDVGSACFGQVSRRLGRFLKRLPKSRSWSDGLRILRRSSSNGSLLTTSGTGEETGPCARLLEVVFQRWRKRQKGRAGPASEAASPNFSALFVPVSRSEEL